MPPKRQASALDPSSSPSAAKTKSPSKPKSKATTSTKPKSKSKVKPSPTKTATPKSSQNGPASSLDAPSPATKTKKAKTYRLSKTAQALWEEFSDPEIDPEHLYSTESDSGVVEEVATEKRAKRFRTGPPASWLERYDRAISQRMFVISRSSTTSTSTALPSSSADASASAPTQTVTLAGTTGNIYRVRISTTCHCTCPDFSRGHECKHIIYVLCMVLKAPSELVYQAAFLRSELDRIFDGAPKIADLVNSTGEDGKDEQGRREPDGDCPVCFMPLVDEVDSNAKGHSQNDLVWCRATCGNNIHAECFKAWARSQKASGERVKCVYCRSEWEEATGDMSALAKSIEAKKKDRRTGYVNIASELGLSGKRDTSTYYNGPGSLGRYL